MLDYTLHMFSLAALQDVTLLAYFCPFMMLLALCILQLRTSLCKNCKLRSQLTLVSCLVMHFFFIFKFESSCNHFLYENWPTAATSVLFFCIAQLGKKNQACKSQINQKRSTIVFSTKACKHINCDSMALHVQLIFLSHVPTCIIILPS